MSRARLLGQVANEQIGWERDIEGNGGGAVSSGGPRVGELSSEMRYVPG